MRLNTFRKVNVVLNFEKKIEAVRFPIQTNETVYAEFDTETTVNNLVIAIFKLIGKNDSNVHIDIIGMTANDDYNKGTAIKGYHFNSEWHGNDVKMLTNPQNNYFQDSKELAFDSRTKLVNALKKDIKATILENITFDKEK